MEPCAEGEAACPQGEVELLSGLEVQNDRVAVVGADTLTLNPKPNKP